MPRISVVVNVRNEAAHLAACLASCRGAEDLVVADMESTDDSVAVAAAAGARVLRLPNAGYCEPGRQPAIDAASEEWVLLIDADERLSGGGLEQLRALAAAAAPDVSGFLLPCPTHLGTQLIRSTGWGTDCERHPRFFRRSHVTWPGRIHATPHFTAAVVDPPPGVTVALAHFKFDSLEHAIAKFNRYTSVEADERRAAARTSTPADAIRDAVAEFTRRYSPDEDGSVSLALSMSFFMYRFLTHMKTIERSGWPPTGVPGDLPMRRAWEAFLETLCAAEHEQARAEARRECARGRFDTAVSRLREAVIGWGCDPATLSDLAALERGRG
jgi:glycosyltransferase involved in cell wall biosynthesis